MIRGLVSGMMWGSVVAAIGLFAASQMMPPPGRVVVSTGAPIAADAAGSAPKKPSAEAQPPLAAAKPSPTPLPSPTPIPQRAPAPPPAPASVPVAAPAPSVTSAAPAATASPPTPPAASSPPAPAAVTTTAAPQPVTPRATPNPVVVPRPQALPAPVITGPLLAVPPAATAPLVVAEAAPAPTAPAADREAAPPAASIAAGARTEAAPAALAAPAAADGPPVKAEPVATPPKLEARAPATPQPPSAGLAEADLPLADGAAPVARSGPQRLATPVAEPLPAAAEPPPPPPLTAEEEALLVPAPAAVPEAAPPASAPLAPDRVPTPEPEPEPDTAAPAASTLAPAPELADAVDGVTINRLPRIGDAAQPAPGAEPAGDDDRLPLQRFARPFENPAAKPVFAVVLIDTGAAGLDRSALAALPFPVSFVIDPLSPGAADAAATYRAAGQEVLMAASGIPAGATAADIEVTFQAHARALPQAVAVIDLQESGFQGNRPLATQVVPVIAGQGRGLVTWDIGLNAADQVARRGGVPAATVFRRLDAGGESVPTMRRYLDRAAFKAAQEGRVVVVGETRPDTVAALLEWAVEGRATSVALAPISALLTSR